MRGSVYYQSSQLAKQIFESGAKKEDRINPNHPHYQKVASYKTMESYRSIWNNFFNYLIEYYPSKQYLEKISASLGKLEIALKLFALKFHNETKEYDFFILTTIIPINIPTPSATISRSENSLFGKKY